MKRAVLTYVTNRRHTNLGDNIQAVAAEQFVGPDAVFLDREKLDAYDGEPVKLAMNGWFMCHPAHFPPAEGIVPLFVAFHLKPAIEKRIFTPSTVAYLKRYEPIGCRSLDMVDMLARHGIRGEFTSCLTLTLGRTFHHSKAPTGRITFVDPHFHRPARKGAFAYLVYFIRTLPHLIRHFSAVRKLADKFRVYAFLPRNRFAPVRWSYAAEFHRAYTSVFDEEVLLTADYLTHKFKASKSFTAEGLSRLAHERLHHYENVPFVVTSLLHCSLPCTAIGTPVWFVYEPEMALGRFEGNLQFLNVLRLGADGRIEKSGDRLPPDGRIHVTSVPPVRKEHLPYAERLAARVGAFMSGEEEGDA